MIEQCELTDHCASTHVHCMWLQYRKAELNTLGLQLGSTESVIHCFLFLLLHYQMFAAWSLAHFPVHFACELLVIYACLLKGRTEGGWEEERKGLSNEILWEI